MMESGPGERALGIFLLDMLPHIGVFSTQPQANSYAQKVQTGEAEPVFHIPCLEIKKG
jgi:hypothetical protein